MLTTAKKKQNLNPIGHFQITGHAIGEGTPQGGCDSSTARFRIFRLLAPIQHNHLAVGHENRLKHRHPALHVTFRSLQFRPQSGHLLCHVPEFSRLRQAPNDRHVSLIQIEKPTQTMPG